jgi:predicted aldo/keto reductase-like oxidoreductase
VLSSPNVDALIVSMTTPDLIDEYVAASGDPRLTESDLELLERYAEMRVGSYCVPGCSACRESCPEGVKIGEVLRARMYDADYGDRVLARDAYAELGAGANACIACTHRACTGTCPARVPIAQLTRDAASRLA